jgi:hypothetical protein
MVDNSPGTRRKATNTEAAGEIGSGTDLMQQLGRGLSQTYAAFVVAAWNGVPWLPAWLASGSVSPEPSNTLQQMWATDQRRRAGALLSALREVLQRLQAAGAASRQRLVSAEYLALVTRCFRSWDTADTPEKQQMCLQLIVNAAVITLCPDDLLRLFLSWIDQYQSSHFVVLDAIFRHPFITRGGIWTEIHSTEPREDSPEADLYRLVIRDLSTGGLIRQARETDVYGRFRRAPKGRPALATGLIESAFDDTKPYVLSELGKQFHHYAMEVSLPDTGGISNRAA